MSPAVGVPPTRRGEVVDVLHGEPVADPYRWLEDVDSAETRAWVAAQNAATAAYLSPLPDRTAIAERLAHHEHRTRYGAPHRAGAQWCWSRHDAGADQPVVVVAASPEAGPDEQRVLLDPNQLSADGTVAVSSWSVSDDGRLLAYALSDAGSDWITWRVRHVDTGVDLPDEVRWSKFCEASWLPDATGFCYGGFDEPAADTALTGATTEQRLQLHRLGTPQAADELLRRDPDSQRQPAGAVTDDGRWLVVTTVRGTDRESSLHVVDLHQPGWDARPLVAEPTDAVEVVGNDGSTFYLLTDTDAPMRRVVAVDLADVSPQHWRTVVPESDDRILSVCHAGGRLVVHRLRDAASVMETWGTDGNRLGQLSLPDWTSVTALDGRVDDPVVHLVTESFTDAGTVWQADLDTGVMRALRGAGSVEGVVVERVRARSTDGTEVPMFLVHRDDVAPDGDARVLLYGYGGFDIAITPDFSATWVTWVERGGLLAVANLRGGGEFGRDWYDAGRRADKQHVFDDFAGCARWLAESGWSRPGRISVHGRSNGGLLVGALLTQHPELIGAAVPGVGVLDLLRFHRFTIGWAWTSDYGDPEDPEEYAWVRAYSPLHHVEPGCAYPATLVTTGDHDDRVVPGHSFKFAAALQAGQGGEAPVLIRVETAAGHGAGKPVSKRVAEACDEIVFCERALRG